MLILKEASPAIVFFYSLITSAYILELCTAADMMTGNQSFTNGDTLVSPGKIFELGFFSFSGSTNRYLGIWYKRFPEIVVWVANRENPLTDSDGVLAISSDGNLILQNGSKSIIWSSSSSRAVPNSIVELSDDGNLILRQKNYNNGESYIWQSFDFPSDTLLPGMKLGCNLTAGVCRYLTSWKDSRDPSPGEFTYGLDSIGLPQFVLRQGSEKKFRTGAWNGRRFSGTNMMPNPVFRAIFVSNSEEVYYMYKFENNSIMTRLTVDQSGSLKRSVLNVGSSDWNLIFSSPNELCDDYGQCGANGICKNSKNPLCECLEGFIPKSQKQWNVLDWSSGCVRRTPLDCHQGEGFVKQKNVKLPDLLEFKLNESMSLKQCEAECLKNCSCTAFTYSDIRGRGSGCLIWFGDLIDIREFSEKDEQDIYIRISASELDRTKGKNRVVLLVVMSTVSGMIALCLLIWFMIQNRKNKRGSEADKEDIELPLFDIATITAATKNFSLTNMIGEGGFGHVYKGKLSTGQEIAVKRLSKNSGQGLEEFRNEIILISRLQHRNLVRLLGCCLEREERMLVYEYMPLKSLDYLIFDEYRRVSVTWQKRFEIATGIAKGLLYLHQDSLLRIIHRDLKASNVLLDSELNPKISDFGIARIFGGDQHEATTRRIIGTYGYMSPEYAIFGKFSVKSDVFSFGVLLIEIVSGRKNTKYNHHPDHHHSILGHAWLLWSEGKTLELMDACLKDSYVESQVIRCIHIGLLCVQKLPRDRPTMSSVVFMLCNDGVVLPQPKEPGFFIEGSCTGTKSLTGEGSYPSENEMTITIPEGR